jgi:hypothetical protein
VLLSRRPAKPNCYRENEVPQAIELAAAKGMSSVYNCATVPCGTGLGYERETRAGPRRETIPTAPGQEGKQQAGSSGVALVDDKTALVVFDNLNHVARIDLSLKRRASNRARDFQRQ